MRLSVTKRVFLFGRLLFKISSKFASEVSYVNEVMISSNKASLSYFAAVVLSLAITSRKRTLKGYY